MKKLLVLLCVNAKSNINCTSNKVLKTLAWRFLAFLHTFSIAVKMVPQFKKLMQKYTSIRALCYFTCYVGKPAREKGGWQALWKRVPKTPPTFQNSSDFSDKWPAGHERVDMFSVFCKLLKPWENIDKVVFLLQDLYGGILVNFSAWLEQQSRMKLNTPIIVAIAYKLFRTCYSLNAASQDQL